MSVYKVLSRRVATSEVYLADDGYVYKSQPKSWTDNEMYFYGLLKGSRYIPGLVQQVGLELIRMEYIPPQRVTNYVEWWKHYDVVLRELSEVNIKHGDLTEYSVLVRDNMPILIDFSESRLLSSPIPSKRPGHDGFWLERAMKAIEERHD